MFFSLKKKIKKEKKEEKQTPHNPVPPYTHHNSFNHEIIMKQRTGKKGVLKI